MQSSGFESDLFENDASSDALVEAGEDGLSEGFEDAFGEDAFEESDEMNGFEEEDGFEADSFESDAFESDAFESDGFESDAFEMEDAADGFEDDSFEEDSFEEDSFEGDAFESDSLESDALEAEGFDEDDALDDAYAEGFSGNLGEAFEHEAAGDELEGEGDDAIEEAFAAAMDAEDEDEFASRVLRGLRRAGRVARPLLLRLRRRALPIGLRLLRQGAWQLGAAGGQELRGAPDGPQPAMSAAAPSQSDAMDELAEIAADEAASEDEVDEFMPVVAGIAGRYAVRNLTSRRLRRSRPRAARALGRAVTRAARRAGRMIVRRYGTRAILVLPRIVRRIVILIRSRRGSPLAAPRLIQRAAGRVASSPRAAARLAGRGSTGMRRGLRGYGMRTRRRPGASRRAVRPYPPI